MTEPSTSTQGDELELAVATAISEIRHRYIDYNLKRRKVMAVDIEMARAALKAISMATKD